jgi:NAD(P)-dependent dehydrogenase (short-subunit alcohol dehydrogenase family)
VRNIALRHDRTVNDRPPPAAPRALVTGGNGNLGHVVARLLASAGFEVHVTVLDASTRASFAYGLLKEGMAVHVADLSREADVARACAEIGSPLAALVHTVGGFHGGPFAEADEDMIDAQYRLNLKSAILILRHAHAALAANPGGASAVLVANRPALSAGPGVAVTTAMKAGLVSLVKSVAEEWKAENIRVNAIAPSIMDTPENRRAMPDADPSLWPTTPQVADVIGALVSDVGAVVTGAVIPVFGRA